MNLKKNLFALLMFASTSAMSAGPVNDAMVSIESMADVTIADFHTSELGPLSQLVKSGKIVMGEPSTYEAIIRILKNLDEENLWLSVISEEANVTIYGEQNPETGICDSILRIESPEQNMVILLAADAEFFKESTLFN